MRGGRITGISIGPQKWLIGGYTLLLTHYQGEDYVILGQESNTGNFDLLGGRTDTKHEKEAWGKCRVDDKRIEVQKTASVELMEETAGLIRVASCWFRNDEAVDFVIESYLPQELKESKRRGEIECYGRCYCLAVSPRIVQDEELQKNLKILRKNRAPKYWLEMKKIVWLKLSDVVKKLKEQAEDKGQILHGIRVRPYDVKNKRYLPEDVLNRRTTKMIASHLMTGHVEMVLNRGFIDQGVRKRKDFGEHYEFLKGSYYYQIN